MIEAIIAGGFTLLGVLATKLVDHFRARGEHAGEWGRALLDDQKAFRADLLAELATYRAELATHDRRCDEKIRAAIAQSEAECKAAIEVRLAEQRAELRRELEARLGEASEGEVAS